MGLVQSQSCADQTTVLCKHLLNRAGMLHTLCNMNPDNPVFIHFDSFRSLCSLASYVLVKSSSKKDPDVNPSGFSVQPRLRSYVLRGSSNHPERIDSA